MQTFKSALAQRAVIARWCGVRSRPKAASIYIKCCKRPSLNFSVSNMDWRQTNKALHC
ncbi:Uncharacterised protein [Ewingella americana]|uniref:Uncharacterized protein n=1 Tax=Ewingella americana TaxID=41202 RepID=A0A377NBF4_9GAMM|nr:Uncharacterised protein [Ewingella americana]